jgi:class 3 adenylate cyclase
VVTVVGEGGWQVLDRLSWRAALGAVDAVRYRPRHVDLLVACGASQPEMAGPLARWLVTVRRQPVVLRVSGLPHAAVRVAAHEAARWFGPLGSVVVRWLSGAAAAAADHAGALTLERPLRARPHPGLLVPHLHAVAVLALDMRGFSALTRELNDTQYLADLVEEYLTALTGVIESDRGVVFQYTGDGLLALFLPELAGLDEGGMLERLVEQTTPALQAAFARLYERWRAEWRVRGRAEATIGLGVGLSFGRATIGFLGPSGKKQFGVVGEPVNLAAFLCAEARAGTLLVDVGSFARAGRMAPAGLRLRLRSRKRHQRVEALCVR